MREFEERLLRRRREYSILRVDRADLSKNVLRGFTGFDIFLEQHPEFAERITFTAQLMPSRTDVPEYAEYLERIEALVAVVNHRHGTPDWMPINLKLRDDLDEAVASYKHYDVMMVNAMFDGMNLVAKEGPLVNERDGVSILSENTGAHEELGEFALSVNPFDVQELADSIYAALTMAPEERARRAAGLKEIVTSRDPGDWIDEQVARHPQEGARRRRGRVLATPARAQRSKPNSRSAGVGCGRGPRARRGGRGGAAGGGAGGGARRAARVAVGAGARRGAGPRARRAPSPRPRRRARPLPAPRAPGAAAGSSAPASSGSARSAARAARRRRRRGTAPARPRRRRRDRRRAPPGTTGGSPASRGHATTSASSAGSAARRADVAPAHPSQHAPEVRPARRRRGRSTARC